MLGTPVDISTTSGTPSSARRGDAADSASDVGRVPNILDMLFSMSGKVQEAEWHRPTTNPTHTARLHKSPHNRGQSKWTFYPCDLKRLVES